MQTAQTHSPRRAASNSIQNEKTTPTRRNGLASRESKLMRLESIDAKPTWPEFNAASMAHRLGQPVITANKLLSPARTDDLLVAPDVACGRNSMPPGPQRLTPALFPQSEKTPAPIGGNHGRKGGSIRDNV